MIETEKYFSVQEVADRYRVDPRTITRWIGDKFFPGARKKGIAKNSPYEIPQSALDHFDALRDATSEN